MGAGWRCHRRQALVVARARNFCAILIAALWLGHASAASAQAARMSAEELLDLAEQAQSAGDEATAAAAYRVLAGDRRIAVRSEARFRLARILIAQGKYRDAAALLRTVLDEQPMAQPAQLEFARVLALLGDEQGARRALREVQAGPLPPEVKQLVSRYSATLEGRKPFGGTLSIALAPDTNINRATRHDVLGTVIGDFTIDEDAKAKSVLGVSARAQAYARKPVSEDVTIVARLSSSANLYGRRQFSDHSIGATIGSEWRAEADQLTIEAGVEKRWYGGEPYTISASLALNHLRPLGPQSQLQNVISVTRTDNDLSSAQSGQILSLSSGIEHALSAGSGLGLTVSAVRQAYREPSLSSWIAQGTILGYHEIGAITVVGTLGYSRLWADAPNYFFSRSRRDERLEASLGSTVRSLRVGAFAPFVRVSIEQNRSNIRIYDFKKVRAEFGMSRSF